MRKWIVANILMKCLWISCWPLTALKEFSNCFTEHFRKLSYEVIHCGQILLITCTVYFSTTCTWLGNLIIVSHLHRTLPDNQTVYLYKIHLDEMAISVPPNSHDDCTFNWPAYITICNYLGIVRCLSHQFSTAASSCPFVNFDW